MSWQAVDDEFTRSAASGGMVGEAMIEAEHRVIEELGPKRRLLMAVNESKDKPVRRWWFRWCGVAGAFVSPLVVVMLRYRRRFST